MHKTSEVARAALGPPTTKATAKLIAELQGGEVAAIETALADVRDAQPGGTSALAGGMLFEQAALLQALANRLFRFAGTNPKEPLAATFLGLGLRALDLSRKSLSPLVAPAVSGASQANVQVNVGRTNELMEREDGQRLVG